MLIPHFGHDHYDDVGSQVAVASCSFRCQLSLKCTSNCRNTSLTVLTYSKTCFCFLCNFLACRDSNTSVSHHFGPNPLEWNISNGGWIAVKFNTALHGALTMYVNDFPLAPPWGWYLLLWINISKITGCIATEYGHWHPLSGWIATTWSFHFTSSAIIRSNLKIKNRKMCPALWFKTKHLQN